MQSTLYKHFADQLTRDAKHQTDKGYLNYSIDAALDGYCKEIDTLTLRERITKGQARVLKARLENKACALKEKGYKAIDKRLQKK